MLTLFDRRTRHKFLRVGGLGLGGLALSDLLALHGQAATPLLRDKSVIFLFLHGGPSQFEMFDPKPEAQGREIRSTTGHVATSLPGVAFECQRSRWPGSRHKLTMTSARFAPATSATTSSRSCPRKTGGANLGSLFARVAGTNHPASGLPRNVALFPRAVDPAGEGAIKDFGRIEATGAELGERLRAVQPVRFSKRFAVARIARAAGRPASAVNATDGLRRAGRPRAAGRPWTARKNKRSTLFWAAQQAFDLERENPRTIARYDTRGLIAPEQISKKWNNHKHYADHVATLGKLLLLARRLCKAGPGFVTVSTSFVWDMHADANHAPCPEGMTYCGVPRFDHAVSALVEDLEARGLHNKISAGCLNGEIRGQHAEGECPRRPRSLGRTGPAAALWRRLAGG